MARKVYSPATVAQREASAAAEIRLALAELHAAALNACAERDTIARALAAGETGPVDSLPDLGALTAARAAAKVKIDRYLDALAEAQRKGPRKARPPVAAKPSPRKGRKVKPLDG